MLLPVPKVLWVIRRSLGFFLLVFFPIINKLTLNQPAILLDLGGLILGRGQLNLNRILGHVLFDRLIITAPIQILHPLIFLTGDLFLESNLSFTVFDGLQLLLHVVIVEFGEFIVVQRGGFEFALLDDLLGLLFEGLLELFELFLVFFVAGHYLLALAAVLLEFIVLLWSLLRDLL